MLGKRVRVNSMRRTRSMTGILVDEVTMDEPPPPSDPPHNLISTVDVVPEGQVIVGPWVPDHRSTAMLSPRYYGTDAANHHQQRLETANFLRTCGLCNRRLTSGRDIYIYRGDTAFCSQECREQRMKQDESKEKKNMAAPKNVESHHDQYSELTIAASESSSNSETVAPAQRIISNNICA